MQRSMIDHSRKLAPGGRLKRYVAMERRPDGGLSPLMENVFRRARTRDAHAKVAQFLALARRG